MSSSDQRSQIASSKGRAKRGGAEPMGQGGGGIENVPVVDNTAIQERQVVATTFANMELTNTKNALSHFMELYELAKAENESLKAEIKERDVDSIQVLEYLRVELAHKTAALDSTERQLKHVMEKHDADVISATSRLQQQVKEKDAQLTTANATNAALHKELEDLSLFSRERQEIILDVDRSKEAHQATITKYERELTKLRFQTIEEKVKLKAAETEMIKKFNSEVDARATILVDVKAKSIHENNKNLVHDKGLLEKEVSDLVTLTTEVQGELKEAQRCAEIDVRIQQEAMRHAAKLNKVARESDAKAQMLETKCQNMTAECDAAIARERADRIAEVQRLQATIDALQKSVDSHRHELVRLRKLARTIVSQRSDLENFFYDALEDVQRMRIGSAASGVSPTVGSSPQIQQHHRSVAAPTSPRNWYALTERSGGKNFDATPLSARVRSRDGKVPDAFKNVGCASARTLRSGSQQLRALPSPRDVELRSAQRGTPSQGHPSCFVTSANTGDPEEAPALPMLREEVGTDDFPDPVDAHHYGDLDWNEKELVIRSLLYFVNQTFYQRRQSVPTSPQSALPSAPPIAFPSQLSNRGGSGMPTATRLPLSITESRVSSGAAGGPSAGGVPPLAPRAPAPPSNTGKRRLSSSQSIV